MKQCSLETPMGRLLRRWSGRLRLLCLLAAAFSLTAACSESPPGTTPDPAATGASAIAAPTPLPTPDVQATVRAAVRAMVEAAPITPTPLPTPDVQAAVRAAVRAMVEAADTPTPLPTPDLQATVEVIVRATIEAATPTPTSVPTPTNTPVPAPTAVPRATAVPTATAPPNPVGHALHDRQEIRVPNGHGGVAPWRDRGGQRIFSPWVYGTIYHIGQLGWPRPYIGSGHEVNDSGNVWTVKLREDAVFQDGTPITAADFKAYWEHGAKPENIAAWGGASLSLGDIKGWDELRAGHETEAEGLVVIDDHTLEITTGSFFERWPIFLAAWHTGISKLDQVLTDDEWFTRPIGAGPYRLTIDPGTEQFVAQADVAEFWDASPNIKALYGLNISDNQVRVIMFENGELDLMSIDSATYEAVLHPDGPFDGLLKLTPYGGLSFIKNRIDMAPLEDLQVRKALAHGADMWTIVRAVWGVTERQAAGLIPPMTRCHNPDARGYPYDPDLARQELAASSYGSTDNLPPLLIDLAGPLMVKMGMAVKQYWKDNLGIDLDILERESGTPRREAAQFYATSLGSWLLDPIQIVSNLTRKDSVDALTNIPGGYPVLDALVEHARSLPLPDRGRCAAYRAVEEEYMDKVYMLPIRWFGVARWLVQPWVIGFESSRNLDINTLPWMYILKH